MKNILKSLVVVTALAAVVANSTLAAFTARATVTNSTFSTGNASLQLMTDLAGASTGANLTDSLPGPSFTNIIPFWTMDYPAKLVNSGSVNLMASASGVLVSDTSTLRDQVNVEAFAWADDGDGIVQPAEIGASYGAPMPLSTWETTPINFGQINTTVVLPVVFRFSVGDLDTVYQGQTTVYDFQFNGTTTGATNP